MKNRIKRINELIKEQISQILLKEFDFPPNLLVTISRVETSKDLRMSKIYVSVFPEEKTAEIMNILKKKNKFVRFKLGEIIKIKFIPDLIFEIEKNILEAGEIEGILEELKKEKKQLK